MRIRFLIPALIAIALALLGSVLALSPAQASPAQASTSTVAPDDDQLAEFKAGKVLRIGTDATFPPFEFTEANGEMVGFDIEMMHALADRAGIPNIEFTQMPFANLVPALQANQIDVAASSIYINEEREEAIDFSDVYYPGGLALMVAEDNNEITSIDDLAGKKVALVNGTKSVEWSAENIPDADQVIVQTNENMFSAVRLGQADAIITGKPAGQYYIAQRPGELKLVGDRLTDENYGFGFQSDADALREAFNAALVTMKSDGSYAELTDKWFGEDSLQEVAGERGIFNISTITESFSQIMKGLGTSILVIVLSLIVSLVMGTLGGLGRLTKIAPLRWLANVYVSVIRGTPLVVQLFFIYFGLPQLGLQLPPLAAGVISLGLYSGSYVTEIFRGAVQSIEAGQMEAARSCGMSQAQAMKRVVLPQALLRMLPPLGNEFVSLTKNSALVSFVTIHEMFLVGQTIISRTFDALTVYVFIGFLYYVLTSVIGLATRQLEKRMAVYI